MTFLIIDGERYALALGETTLGGRDDEVLRDSPLGAQPPFAVVRSDAEGASIRALSLNLPVFVGDERLGPHPRALRHGDYLTVGALTIHVGDLDKAGGTDHVDGVTDAEVARHASLPSADPTAPTGGCLTALSDGRMYAIPATGLSIGRDPDCAVVLTSRRVSRRHARVVPGLLGYSLVDESTNGSTVNGAWLAGTTVLSQGDVISIGDAAFRFSADTATYEPDPALFAAPQVPLQPSATASPGPTMPDTETVPRAKRPTVAAKPSALPLATLEVISGAPAAGSIFRVERAVVQIGRNADNDIRLVDPGVSGAHATLMQRGDVWQILDLGSRNGTFVEAQRITECVLRGVCQIRIGTVLLLFRPLRSGAADSMGTLGVIGLTDAPVNSK